MSEFYIATRASHTAMASATGQRVGRLNQKMATTLRRGAMKLGIKQNTRDGGRLEFYSVDQSGFDMLCDPKNKLFAVLKGAVNVRPLAYLKQKDMVSAINAVNAKYGRSMDRATFAKYNRELEAATDNLLTKLDEDVKVAKPKPTNPGFAVGDWISHGEWRTSYPAQIVKITDAGYQYQVYVPRTPVLRQPGIADWVKQFVGGSGWGNQWDGEVKIPFQANREWFVPVAKLVNRRWSSMSCFEKPGQTDVVYSTSWYMD
jgi:hypothetical protein